MNPRRAEPQARGVYLALKRGRNGAASAVLRVNWVEGKKARRTTVSVERHGLDKALALALRKISPFNRQVSMAHVRSAVIKRAAELGVQL